MHQAEPVTIADLRWLLRKATAALVWGEAGRSVAEGHLRLAADDPGRASLRGDTGAPAGPEPRGGVGMAQRQPGKACPEPAAALEGEAALRVVGAVRGRRRSARAVSGGTTGCGRRVRDARGMGVRPLPRKTKLPANATLPHRVPRRPPVSSAGRPACGNYRLHTASCGDSRPIRVRDIRGIRETGAAYADTQSTEDADLQGFPEATGLEPATSGVTGRNGRSTRDDAIRRRATETRMAPGLAGGGPHGCAARGPGLRGRSVRVRYPSASGQSDYEIGLDLILDGLERTGYR
jgi:hypothetical protein